MQSSLSPVTLFVFGLNILLSTLFSNTSIPCVFFPWGKKPSSTQNFSSFTVTDAISVTYRWIWRFRRSKMRLFLCVSGTVALC